MPTDVGFRAHVKIASRIVSCQSVAFLSVHSRLQRPGAPGSGNGGPTRTARFTLVIAKFHYTGSTGPTRTFFAARVSEKVRAGPCSGI